MVAQVVALLAERAHADVLRRAGQPIPQEHVVSQRVGSVGVAGDQVARPAREGDVAQSRSERRCVAVAVPLDFARAHADALEQSGRAVDQEDVGHRGALVPLEADVASVAGDHRVVGVVVGQLTVRVEADQAGRLRLDGGAQDQRDSYARDRPSDGTDTDRVSHGEETPGSRPARGAARRGPAARDEPCRSSQTARVRAARASVPSAAPGPVPCAPPRPVRAGVR